MLLHSEDTAIKDLSKIKIDWLLDIKELEISADGNKSVVEVGDASVSTFGSKLFFGEKSISF